MLSQVLLMILLGAIESWRGLDLGDNGTSEPATLVEFGFLGLGGSLLRRRMIEYY
jgi:hypothetical protein